MLNKNVKALPHLFMPGETIVAAIKSLNMYDVSKDEMKQLLKTYDQINGKTVVKAGTRVMVPILERHYVEVFKSLRSNIL
jgi:hypothetical protein